MKKQPLEVFYKKAVLKTLANIHRKTPVLESLFNKVAERYFPAKFEKFLRTPFFTEHLQWLILKSLFLKVKVSGESV